MNHEQQEVADQVRSGQYFAEARQWYSALYIGPISERSFFLIIAGLAGLVALIGLVALARFLPLTERPGILISTNAPETQTPAAHRIRPAGQPLSVALERFLIQNYVERRESYRAQDFARNFAFIRAHSDAPTFTNYSAIYGPTNPRSPASILGVAGKRIARVSSITINPSVEPKVAVIKFSTELEGVGAQAKTQWTATVGYYYSPMQTTEAEGPGGETEVTVEDPQFKVVNYAVSQTP